MTWEGRAGAAAAAAAAPAAAAAEAGSAEGRRRRASSTSLPFSPGRSRRRRRGPGSSRTCRARRSSRRGQERERIGAARRRRRKAKRSKENKRKKSLLLLAFVLQRQLPSRSIGRGRSALRARSPSLHSPPRPRWLPPCRAGTTAAAADIFEVFFGFLFTCELWFSRSFFFFFSQFSFDCFTFLNGSRRPVHRDSALALPSRPGASCMDRRR